MSNDDRQNCVCCSLEAEPNSRFCWVCLGRGHDEDWDEEMSQDKVNDLRLDNPEATTKDTVTSPKQAGTTPSTDEQVLDILREYTSYCISESKAGTSTFDTKAALLALIAQERNKASTKMRKDIIRSMLLAEPYEQGDDWIAVKFTKELWYLLTGEIVTDDRLEEEKE